MDKRYYGKYHAKDIYSLATPPVNEKESIDYGNALYSDGHYPAGLKGCFTVGISGGCGTSCYVYLEGKCECPEEMVERLSTEEETETHLKLYGIR